MIVWLLTFVEVEHGERDDVGPRRSFAKADAVPGAAEQLSSGHQIAVLGRFEFQP